MKFRIIFKHAIKGKKKNILLWPQAHSFQDLLEKHLPPKPVCGIFISRDLQIVSGIMTHCIPYWTTQIFLILCRRTDGHEFLL